MAAIVFCIGTAPLSADTVKKEKVILSADMVDLFDDGVAMLMLAKSPKVDLLGVAVVIGNTWVETGTASAIRQLEGIKRTDIPVLMGVNKVHREGRIAAIQDEKTLFGRVAPTPMMVQRAIRNQSLGRMLTGKLTRLNRPSNPARKMRLTSLSVRSRQTQTKSLL